MELVTFQVWGEVSVELVYWKKIGELKNMGGDKKKNQEPQKLVTSKISRKK